MATAAAAAAGATAFAARRAVAYGSPASRHTARRSRRSIRRCRRSRIRRATACPGTGRLDAIAARPASSSRNRAARRRRSPREKIPLEVALNARDGGEYSASNPITAAAAPLLILLGRLRLLIVDMQAVPLMNHVAQEIRDFEKKAGEAGVSAGRHAGREIRALRHRRRHRPEPAGHRPACLDAVFACWRSSSRCAPRASASSRS